MSNPSLDWSLFPDKIAAPLRDFRDAEDGAARHKALLGLGESMLIYIVGILFGEYKRSGKVVDEIEVEFYRHSSRKPSLGHFISFFRLLTRNLPDSILAPRLNNGIKYPGAGVFIKEFELIRQVVDQGADSNFSAHIESLKKGQTISAKTIHEFFDVFVMMRNIFAHPEDKAGRDIKRKWPLHPDYFNAINPALENALTELLSDWDVLASYRPILLRMLDDKNLKGVFSVEVGDKPSDLELDLSSEEISMVATNLRYLLDEQQRLFIQLYYHAIPPVNSGVARRIIETEKARERLPVLKEMVRGKLLNDSVIDELELLVLRDTAKTNYISDETLFGLIEDIRSEMGIHALTGTPEKPGNLFVRDKGVSKEGNIFNPWLLKYFSLVGRLSKEEIKKENEKAKQLKNEISESRKSIRLLPVMKRIDAMTDNVKEVKRKRRDILQKIKESIRNRKEELKSEASDLQKENIRLELSQLEASLTAEDQNFSNELTLLESGLAELEKIRLEETAKLEGKLAGLEKDYETYYNNTVWGSHRNVWNECSAFVESLMSKNLNRPGEDAKKWVNSVNSWQIGQLSYIYWAKIHPETAPLGQIVHTGLAICNEFKWTPKTIDTTLRDKLRKPAVLLWTSVDDLALDRLNLNDLHQKSNFNQAMVLKYEKELSGLGISVKIREIGAESEDPDAIDMMVPLEKYLADRDRYTVRQVYSRLWSLDDFFIEGVPDRTAITRFENEMTALLQLFTNAVEMANEYALQQGINSDNLAHREDVYQRLRNYLINEFQSASGGKDDFVFSTQQMDDWRARAAKDFGCSGSLFNKILNQYKRQIRQARENENDDNVLPSI